MNLHGIKAIYRFEIPGLIMLSLLNESISNASFGIYMPKWAGTIYELLSAPVSSLEIVIGYVGAAATKSVVLGMLILVTARVFVPFHIEHPLWMLCFLLLTSVSFSLFGFIIGLWADDFQKLQVVPLMIVTPLTFLGGAFSDTGASIAVDAAGHGVDLPAASAQVVPLMIVTPLTFLGGAFYSISMLPPVWQKITLFNPVVYLISGFRWSFYGISDVNVVVSVAATIGFLLLCLGAVWWIFRTGYKLKA